MARYDTHKIGDNSSILIGQDPSEATINHAYVDDGGRLRSVGYHWDAETLSFVVDTGINVAVGAVEVSGVAISNFPPVQDVTINPMADYDVSITYDAGLPDQITISGGGQTKTLALGYTDGYLTSIQTTIS